MNIEIRKRIRKFPIVHRLCVKIVDFNNAKFYKAFNYKFHHDDKLKELKNVNYGKRCFVIGNGPSLRCEDLELIKDEDSFAANKIYEIFDKTDWRPTYYVLQDRYVEANLEDINASILFIGDYYWRKNTVNNPRALCIHSARCFGNDEIVFSTDISKMVVAQSTVTYAMIQIAAYMGYKEIYLLGVDHDYILTYDLKGNVVKNSIKANHFFSDQKPNEIVADIEGMNKAYLAARKYACLNNLKICNLTRGGKLEWFERDILELVVKND